MWASWNYRTEVSKNEKPLFKWCFSRRDRRDIFNSLFDSRLLLLSKLKHPEFHIEELV